MKKSKIKIMSLMLALSMALSLFVACGDDPAKEPVNDPAGGADGQKEVVELTWWLFGDPPKNGDAAMAAMNEKSVKDLGIKINYIWATGNDEKLKVALSTGQDDDIAFTCSWFCSYSSTAQKGQFYDITDLLQTEGKELYDYIPDYVWEAARIKDRIYAIPTYKDSAATFYWMCNKEYVIDAAGAGDEFNATNEDLASLTPVLKKVKAYADSGNPYPHDLTGVLNHNNAGFKGLRASVSFETILDEVALGIRADDNEYKVISRYEDPNYVKDLKTIQSWYQAGYPNQDCEQLDKDPEFIVIDCAQGWKGAETSVWGLNKDYTVAINKKCGPVANAGTVMGSANAVFLNSKHPEEAIRFLQYANLNSDYRNMLAYGKEGENWERSADGTINTLNDDYSPQKWAQATFFTMDPAYPAPPDMYKDMKTEMDGAKPSALIGFVPDISSFKNELAACSVAQGKVVSSLNNGTVKDVDASIASLLDEMNGVGYQKIRDELQKQVDAFLGK